MMRTLIIFNKGFSLKEKLMNFFETGLNKEKDKVCIKDSINVYLICKSGLKSIKAEGA